MSSREKEVHPGRTWILRGPNASTSTRGPLGLILLANLWPAKTTMLHIPVIFGYRPRCKPLWSSMLHLHPHAALYFLSLDLGYHCFSLLTHFTPQHNSWARWNLCSLLNKLLHILPLYGNALSSPDHNKHLAFCLLPFQLSPFSDTWVYD